MQKYSKKEFSSMALKQLYLEHLRSHQFLACIFTDGSKSQDKVGYAFVHGLTKYKRRIQNAASIFTAELYAIYDSLNYAESLPHRTIIIITDSSSAISAITQYNPSNPLIVMIQSRIANSSKHFTLCWVPGHVGVAGNERADRAAKDALEGNLNPVCLPRSDFKWNYKKEIRNQWNLE
jgi:ribonuclease HI